MLVTEHVCSAALFVSHGLPVVIQHVAEVLAGGTKGNQGLGWQVAADSVQGIKW